MAMAPAITLKRMYHCVPMAISRMLPQFRVMWAATKKPTITGKVMFTGNEAPICASGCMKRATEGLKPIHTPTGVHTSVANTVMMATRPSVSPPSQKMCPTSSSVMAPCRASAAATTPRMTS